MPRLRYLASAKADLVGITRYIARQSGDRAVGRRFAQLLRQQCRHLADLPGTLGSARPELGAGIRSFPYRGYVVFFRYGADTLEVVTILEGHRDVTGAFGG